MAAAARLVNGWNDGRDQEKALAAMGLKPETPLGDPPLLLPSDCIAPLELFITMTTQAHHAGMSAAFTGLRYEALPVVRAALAIPEADWPAVFEDLRLMEMHAVGLTAKRVS